VRLVTLRSSRTIQALALGVLAWLAAPSVFGSPQAVPSPRQYLQIVCRKFALDDAAIPAAVRNKLKALARQRARPDRDRAQRGRKNLDE
jgi:hypothetical protein